MSCRCGPCRVATGETHYCDGANDALVYAPRATCPRCSRTKAAGGSPFPLPGATPHDASPVAARRAFSDDDLGLYELVGAPPAARRYVDDPECLVCSPGPCFAGCPSLS